MAPLGGDTYSGALLLPSTYKLKHGCVRELHPENHIKTNSMGLQCQADCCYKQEAPSEVSHVQGHANGTGGA